MDVKVNEIYTFKLCSGEEIIGKVIKIITDSNPHYVIESPLGTTMTQNGLHLVPGLLTINVDASVNMYFTSLAIVGIPRTDILDVYRESVTGIQVPKKQILMS
jgi:hypothetical protein